MLVVLVKNAERPLVWQKEHITLTYCLLPPESIAGDLVPFWTICFILLWQWIIVRKENQRRVNVPTLCYSKLEDLLCLCTSLRFWAYHWCTTQM